MNALSYSSDNGEMRNYIVLYRDNILLIADAPLCFSCMAEDGDHAQEQCENAYPDCEVVWVFEGSSSDAAYDDYFKDTP